MVSVRERRRNLVSSFFNKYLVPARNARGLLDTPETHAAKSNKLWCKSPVGNLKDDASAGGSLPREMRARSSIVGAGEKYVLF